ncbi:hypothetical protein D3C87_2014490 [compost metagenome]
MIEQHAVDGRLGPWHGDAELGIGAAGQPIEAIDRLQQALLRGRRTPQARRTVLLQRQPAEQRFA